MSAFFTSSYDVEDSEDDDVLYYSDDARYNASIAVADGSSSDEEELIESQDESESSEDDSEADSISDESVNGDSEDWGSDSDSDSDDEAPKGRDYFLKKDFLKGGNDDSDSEDEKKIVKSAKDKYLDEIEALVDQLETFSMVEEWIKLNTELEKLLKLIPKHKQYQIQIPRSYIKVLCAIDDSISNQNKETLKLLAPSQSKNLMIVKQKVKKELKNYVELVEQFRFDPVAFESTAISTVGGDNDEEAENDDSKKSKLDKNSNVFSVILSILDSRGKKNVDHKDQISDLEYLLTIEKNSAYENITILMLLISIRFDLHSKAPFMPLDAWTSSFDEVTKLLDILDSNDEFIVTEAALGNEDITTPPPKSSDGKMRIVGSITSLIERLAEELNSHLLHIDPNSNEYITRLKDEVKLYSLIVRGQVYYTKILPKESYGELEGDQLTRLIIRRLDFIYYKPINLIILSELNAWNVIDNEDAEVSKITSNEANAQNTDELIDSLCSQVYEYSNHGSGSQRKRAALMQSYYYSTCDQFYRAREILQLTNVQSVIQTSEVSIQVLFNRAVVQLGLSAFRIGQIDEARSILFEVATSNRIREVLGQGNNRSTQSNQPIQALTSEGETVTIGGERHVPFHMHINIQLLETVYYITSLLIEIPLMALSCYQGKIGDNTELWAQLQQSRRNGGSKTFRRVLEYAVRQYFRGPAEDARDSVILSALDFIKGDWKMIIERFQKLNIWAMMPGLETTPEEKTNKIMNMLEKNIKQSSLSAWIYCEAGILRSYPLNRLSKRFDLPLDEVTAIVGLTISKDDIGANLKVNDNGEISVVFQEKSKGSMSEIIKGFTEKINSVVERNEKLSLGGYQVMMKKK